jgi:hypothetical protein
MISTNPTEFCRRLRHKALIQAETKPIYSLKQHDCGGLLREAKPITQTLRG